MSAPSMRAFGILALSAVMSAAGASAPQAQTGSASQPHAAAGASERPAHVDGADPEKHAFVRTISVQVALDRAGFSPGVIDGAMGSNTRRALEAFVQQHGGPPALAPDALTAYTLTESDVSGPFVPAVPVDLMEQAELSTLGYTSPLEALAERFHTLPRVLQRLNPDARYAAGDEILVPHVVPFSVPARRDVAGTSGRNGAKQPEADGRLKPVPPLPKPDVVVTVSKAAGALQVQDAHGRVIFHAPVTTGSEHDPLPLGEWKVTGVSYTPQFNYNPELFWDADPSHARARIQPGPNNPVGVVWIDLTKEHYGIHGTPEPASVGRSASHGCVRLTNWDVTELASLVGKGTRVVFTQ